MNVSKSSNSFLISYKIDFVFQLDSLLLNVPPSFAGRTGEFGKGRSLMGGLMSRIPLDV
jgi:hypothetical protein